jgi:hypothetical protein
VTATTTDTEYGIVLFDTTQAAIKAEKVLKKQGSGRS